MARAWFILSLPNTLGWNSLIVEWRIDRKKKKNTSYYVHLWTRRVLLLPGLPASPTVKWIKLPSLLSLSGQTDGGTVLAGNSWSWLNFTNLQMGSFKPAIAAFQWEWIETGLARRYSSSISVQKYNAICFPHSCPRPHLQEPEVHSKIPLSL